MTYTTRTPESDALNAFHFLQAHTLHKLAAPALGARLRGSRLVRIYLLVLEVKLLTNVRLHGPKYGGNTYISHSFNFTGTHGDMVRRFVQIRYLLVQVRLLRRPWS